MKNKKLFLGGMFVIALAMSAVSLYMLNDSSKSSASIIKNGGQAVAERGLSNVTYNGENMFVARSTFFDYHSDTQVGSGATPGEITDAYDWKKNTFGKFNTRLMEVMKYNNKAECPAKYPLYQGRQGQDFSDYANIFKMNDNSVNENSNYWIGANSNQVGAYAMQGLVDAKLAYDSSGNSYITQSNPDNGKTAYLPYFDKKVLTGNKFKDSELTIGSVRENVAFPFRKEEKDGITYYEFDSATDTVRFNSSNQLDYKGVEDGEKVKDRLGVGGLFPDNVPADSNSNKLNFGYGVKIEVPFNMTSDGKIGGKDMIFEFTGDDDVWVFIDGILALDMGGAHPKISGSINFATGKAVVSGVRNPAVGMATRTMTGYGTSTYTNRELGLIDVPAVYNNFTTAFSEDLKQKLKDTRETHTLTLFYMERGMDVSNMKMKFNLPEPTKLTVENKVAIDNVGKAFEEETKKVAKKDVFLYDVVDKTKGAKASIDMVAGDNVLFSNEFAAKNVLLVQQNGLKGTTRKLEDYYATSWKFSDAQNEISKGDGLVVKDPRREDKTILFKNEDDDKVPVLYTVFTNKPLVGKFTLFSNVSDKFKEKVTDYKEKEIKYVVTYKKVFGGESETKKYNGKYQVVDGDETKDKEAKDGIIKLKPGQKAIISGVPVNTQISVKAEISEDYVVSSVKTTSGFTYDSKEVVATGTINRIANVVDFEIGDKSEKEEKEPEKLTDKEVEDITGEEIPKVEEPEKLEDTKVTPGTDDEYDDAVATGDETDIKTWSIIMAISLLLTFGSGVSLAAFKSRK